MHRSGWSAALDLVTFLASTRSSRSLN